MTNFDPDDNIAANECTHEQIQKHPIEEEYVCASCGLTGSSEDDIRGEGSIEVQVEAEQSERENLGPARLEDLTKEDKRRTAINTLQATLAQTPQELFALMDEKMFRQIMNGFITIKLRPHDKLIGYYILSVQGKDVAFVPDAEEGCKFVAAMMLKAANTIPKLREYDNEVEQAQSQRISNGNGLIKIVH